MIAIIDYGLGNSVSVGNMIRKAGGVFKISSDERLIRSADKVILPGVGHFSRGMDNLISSGLDKVIIDIANQGTHILGICLGAQLLTDFSEEGNRTGLGLIPINTKKFNFSSSEYKVPHMGWKEIEFNKDIKHPYFNEMHQKARFYFVHSYYMEIVKEEYVVAKANYLNDFAACVGNKNVTGMQFHPEKSHKFGMKVFENFVNQ